MVHSTLKTSPFMHRLEENIIAFILALMTLIIFADVVTRGIITLSVWIFGYVPKIGLLWAQEATVFLFAWLVLIGASYAVKVKGHLGVDALINLFSSRPKHKIAIFASFACVIYAFLLLKGAWDYWAVFADLPPTSGKWFPLGFEDKFRSQSFYEVDDIPMIPLFNFLESWINYGDSYEKLPKVVPYFVLPLSMTLLLFRFVQVFIAVIKGKMDSMIASHEAEEALEELNKNAINDENECVEKGRNS